MNDERPMDKDIKDLMKRLGDAINESMQDSEKIQRLLGEMQEHGYTLTLSLAVILGLDQQQNRARRKPKRETAGEREAGYAPTPFDRKFLKALRIKISEEPHA